MKCIDIIPLVILCGLSGCERSVAIQDQDPKARFVSILDKQKKDSETDFPMHFFDRDDISASVDFRAPAARVTPAVVLIRSHWSSLSDMTILGNEHPFRKFFGDDQWFHFFEPFINPPMEASASGIILTPDGYIVTNNHVVDGTDSIEVLLSDQRSYQAKIVGVDKDTDLALIKIDEQNLPFIKIGNSDRLEVGEWVLAVGNPLNLTSTVTAGIVSAMARSVQDVLDDGGIGSFIQTDAVINSGNSGGALVNARGELVGVNTAIATSSGAYAGYSFAIPVNVVKKVTDDLLNFGTVHRASLGVVIRDMTGELAKSRNIKFTQGAFVDSLAAEGVAEKAGVRVGDIITKANTKNIHNSAQLQELVAERRPGDVLLLTVIRDNAEHEFRIVLKQVVKPKEVDTEGKVAVLDILGIDVREITDPEKKSSGLGYGLIVTNIRKGKISDYTTMRLGFIITKADDIPVKTKEDLVKILQSKGERSVMLEGKYPGFNGTVYYGFGI